MKLNFSDFPRKCQFPLMIALGMLPLPAMLLLHNAPEAIGALFTLIPASLLLTWLCLVLPGKIRVLCGLFSCAMLTLFSIRLLPIAQSIHAVGGTLKVSSRMFTVFIPLLLCAMLLYCLRFAAWPREREIAFNWYAAGGFTHLAFLAARFFALKQGKSQWAAALTPMTFVFIAFLTLVLLSANRSTMHGAALGRQRVPHAMRHRNTLITLSVLCIALVIAGIEPIIQLLSRIGSAVLGAIGALIAYLARLLESDLAPMMPGEGGGAQSGLPALPYEEPSALAKALEALVVAAASLLIAAAFFFALRMLVRKLRALIAALHARLMNYLAAASDDYVDEITDTRDARLAAERSVLVRLRSRFAFVDENKLSPNARIRYRYARLLKKHPDWPKSQTARESLTRDAANLYEQARYSGDHLSAEAAEQFAKQIRHL